jgi:hypothetical protein
MFSLEMLWGEEARIALANRLGAGVRKAWKIFSAEALAGGVLSAYTGVLCPFR